MATAAGTTADVGVDAVQQPAAPVPLRRACACGMHTTAGAECGSCRSGGASTTEEPGAVPQTGVYRSVGRGGARPIFPKPAVSVPGDPYEQEADRVADEVVGMPDVPHAGTPAAPSEGSGAEARRQADPAAPETDDEEQVRRQADPDVEQEEVQRKATGEAPTVDDELENRLDRARGGGEPLSAESRAYFEPRFGRDLGGVRVHTDPEAGRLAGELNALAFTRGSHVWFAPGRYAPGSPAGRHLLAHELAHTLQPAGDATSVLGPVRRKAAPAPSTEGPEAGHAGSDSGLVGEGGTFVRKLGVVAADEGLALRAEPSTEGAELARLPLNTVVFVNKAFPGRWYYVVLDDGRMGYVARDHVPTDMPDPGSRLHRIAPGEGALRIVQKYYKGDAIKWGQDERFFVNVLVLVNTEHGRHGIHKPAPPPAVAALGIKELSWETTQTRAGSQIWIPSLEFALMLKGRVSSGSISREALRAVTDFFEAIGEFIVGGVAFVAGLVVGALECVWDTLTGVVDLVRMVASIIKSLVMGELLDDIKKLGETVSQLNVQELLYALGDWLNEKWNNPSMPKRWYWRGWILGYVIVEVLLLIFSGGLVSAAKWLGKTAKIAKLLDRFPAFMKIVGKAKGLGGKKVDEVKEALRASKVIRGLTEAREWASRVLKIPAELVANLTKEAIERLQRMPVWMRARFADLRHTTMKWLLGCDSPCKVNIGFIEKWMAEAGSDAVKSSKVLSTPADVLRALPAEMNKARIAKYLGDHPALMAAIKEAKLTEADFDKIVHFLSASDKASPKAAYETFTRYLSHVVPAKAGNKEKAFNDVVEAMISAAPGQGAALKGSMFEIWVRMHLPEFASKDFARVVFTRAMIPGLRKAKRSADNFVAASGELWEIKHTFDKVPLDQALDYATMIGKMTPQGTVKTVNYLFAAKEMAGVNAHLKKLGFVVWYVEGGVRKAL